MEGILAVNGYVSGVEYDRFETEIFVPAGGERTAVLPVTVQTMQEIFTADTQGMPHGETAFAVFLKPADGMSSVSSM